MKADLITLLQLHTDTRRITVSEKSHRVKANASTRYTRFSIFPYWLLYLPGQCQCVMHGFNGFGSALQTENERKMSRKRGCINI